MNGAKICHSKSGTLETIKWRHILFPGLYASIQATAIVQFQLKIFATFLALDWYGLHAIVE